MSTGALGGAGGGPGAQDANAAAGASGAGTGDDAKGNQGKKPDQNKKCDKKLSKEDKKSLRSKTPDAAATNKVNEKSPQNCPACGKMVSYVSADHIVPASMIMKMPGFPCLGKTDQAKMLNYPNNFAPLCPPCNMSKNSKLWHKWKGYKGGGFASGAPVQQNQDVTNALLKDIKGQIKG